MTSQKSRCFQVLDPSLIAEIKEYQEKWDDYLRKLSAFEIENSIVITPYDEDGEALVKRQPSTRTDSFSMQTLEFMILNMTSSYFGFEPHRPMLFAEIEKLEKELENLLKQMPEDDVSWSISGTLKLPYMVRPDEEMIMEQANLDDDDESDDTEPSTKETPYYETAEDYLADTREIPDVDADSDAEDEIPFEAEDVHFPLLRFFYCEGKAYMEVMSADYAANVFDEIFSEVYLHCDRIYLYQLLNRKDRVLEELANWQPDAKMLQPIDAWEYNWLRENQYDHATKTQKIKHKNPFQRLYERSQFRMKLH